MKKILKPVKNKKDLDFNLKECAYDYKNLPAKQPFAV